MSLHHPNRELYPEWTLDLGNRLFHKVVTVTQRMKPTIENIAKLRALIDSLEYVYLMMRKALDCEDRP